MLVSFVRYTVTGYICTFMGFSAVLLPGLLPAYGLVGIVKALIGFTIIIGTAPVLLHAAVLTKVVSK